MRRIFCICFFSVAVNLCVYTEIQGSALVPPDHWIYDGLSYLSVETGDASLAVNGPSSYNELRVYFEAVRYDSLSGSGRSVYRKILDFLGPRAPLWTSGRALLDIRPVLSLSGTLVQNPDAYFTFEKLSRFNETLPLISLPVLIGFSPFVTGYSDFTLGEGYWKSMSAGNYTNIPGSADSFDLNVPSRSYFSAGNSFFTASAGRGALNMGRTLSGSMILSSSADRLDYASFVFFSPAIRFSFTPVELAPHRFVYFHDLTVRPLPFLTLRFAEAASVASSLDLRYLNPVMIYHSYAGWRDDYGQDEGVSPVGTQFAISADLVPARGVRLYGQFVMNQFQTSYELSTYEDTASSIPNSLGALTGAEIIRGVGDGFFSVAVEGIYANPWLYILSNENISFFWSRKELVAPSGCTSKEIVGWLGSPFGPDTMAGFLQVLYDVPLAHKTGFQYSLTAKGWNAGNYLQDMNDTFFPPGGRYSGVQHSVSLTHSRFFGSQLELDGKFGYSMLKDGIWISSALASFSLTWNFCR